MLMFFFIKDMKKSFTATTEDFSLHPQDLIVTMNGKGLCSKLTRDVKKMIKWKARKLHEAALIWVSSEQKKGTLQWWADYTQSNKQTVLREVY